MTLTPIRLWRHVAPRELRGWVTLTAEATEPSQTTIGNSLLRGSQSDDKRPGKGFFVRVRLGGRPLQLALAGGHCG